MSPSRRDNPWRRWGLPALLVLAMFGCFLGRVEWMLNSIYRGMEGELRRNEVHRLALRAAEASPLATEVLGSPLSSHELTLFAHGSTPEAGLVDFELEVEGPRGRGVLEVKAALAQGQWTLRELTLRPASGERRVLPAVGSTPALPPR
jgi:hypothetical protein